MSSFNWWGFYTSPVSNMFATWSSSDLPLMITNVGIMGCYFVGWKSTIDLPPLYDRNILKVHWTESISALWHREEITTGWIFVFFIFWPYSICTSAVEKFSAQDYRRSHSEVVIWQKRLQFISYDLPIPKKSFSWLALAINYFSIIPQFEDQKANF